MPTRVLGGRARNIYHELNTKPGETRHANDILCVKGRDRGCVVLKIRFECSILYRLLS
jgi:hypothetical protein